MGLSGTVAVVPVGARASARADALVERLAAAGATILLVTGGDGDEAGRLVSALEDHGRARPGVFHLGDDPGDLDALVEFVGEMFRPSS